MKMFFSKIHICFICETQISKFPAGEALKFVNYLYFWLSSGKRMTANGAKNMGSVFTPVKWARFAIEKYGLFHKWMNGASVLDPTMGDSSLLISLIETGLGQGYDIHDLPVKKLYGIELNKDHYNSACRRLQNICGKDFRKRNFQNSDVLFCTSQKKVDLVFGNPPWINFSALPKNYRDRLKPLYIRYGLAHSGRKLLLGNSQINIAALIIFRVIADFMSNNAEAVVFMPMSVLFHSGAHHAFTSGRVGNVDFCVQDVTNLENTDAFTQISTKFGVLQLQRDKKQKFPVKYTEFDAEGKNWVCKNIIPFQDIHGPLQVTDQQNTTVDFKKISIPYESKPRQGINTCGANHVYFFNCCSSLKNGLCEVSNETGRYILPGQFVYPLIHKDNFRNNALDEKKYILLPYTSNGKPLKKEALADYPELKQYLEKNKNVLIERKGKMIGKFIESGIYWALLGVGAYNFFPYKIVWEACGKNYFRPALFEGRWQANQSLQTYIPVQNKKICRSIYKQLTQSDIANVLETMKMGGTMCFAQPGIMSSFFQYK